MAAGGSIAGVHQSHCEQVASSGNFRFAILFECAQQLGHGADEGVGEPDGIPVWLVPGALIVDGGVAECAGCASGVVRPADGSQCQSCRSFDSPADSDVAAAAFASGSGPDIIPDGGLNATWEIEDTECDPVCVLEAPCGARVWSNAGVDSQRISQPVPQSIQMMNAHDSQGDPALAFLPWHPVGDGSHFDCGEHGCTECLLTEECMAGADGLIESHVLIDSQQYVVLFAESDEFSGFATAGAEWFLGKDTAEPVSGIECATNDIGLAIGRDSDVEDLDFGVLHNLFDGLTDGRDLPAGSGGGGGAEVSRGDGDWSQLVPSISGEVAVGHDEAGADAADADGSLLWQHRLDGLQDLLFE